MLLDYQRLGATSYQGLGRVYKHLSTTLERDLIHIVFLRISQMNGCAYCVDLHWRDAVKTGVSRNHFCYNSLTVPV